MQWHRRWKPKVKLPRLWPARHVPRKWWRLKRIDADNVWRLQLKTCFVKTVSSFMFERVTQLLTVVAIPQKYATNTKTYVVCTAMIAKPFFVSNASAHTANMVSFLFLTRQVRWGKKSSSIWVDFEKLAKPMSVQESQVRSVLSHHQALYPGLTLDNLVGFLREKFSVCLRNDGQNLMNIVKKKSMPNSKSEANQNVFVVSKKSSDQIASLRKMLSMSDGVCVSTFVESTSQLKSSIEEQKKELNVFTVRTWTNSLDNIIKSSVASALAAWEFPNALRQNILLVDVVTTTDYRWKDEFCVNIHMPYDFRQCVDTSGAHKNFCNSTLEFVTSALSLQFHCIERFSNRSNLKKSPSNFWQIKKYTITGGASSVFFF